MSRVRILKLILWALGGMGLAVATARLVFGLGPTTNLSDGTPWGLWIGFDVMGGVALAAGGFVITAVVYIFRKDEYHHIVRPAVLTAFLGYIAVIVGLMLDLGLPWNIWRPMFNWQHHSVLFEVAWCVMLYTTVLALEFSPVPLELASRYAKIRAFMLKIRLPLVIVGISLSTLHQSSLGSLFLIMPYRLHPLWYSPVLPPLFFISAIGLGLMMITFEGLFTTFIYKKESETPLLAKLGKGARWVLLFYIAFRLGDLFVRGQLGHAFTANWHTLLFWTELGLSAIIPALLLFIPAVRRNPAGQWTIAIMGVTGFVMNRLSVGGLAQIRSGAPFYLPAWSEVAVSAGVVAGAALLFLFAVEYLKVWEKQPQIEPIRPGSRFRLDYALIFILMAGIGWALMSGETAHKRGINPTPVHYARGGDTLWIDGNIDGYGAIFTHKAHMKGYWRGESCVGCHDAEPVFGDGHRIGEAATDPTCVRCHHMNLPRDLNTTCATCHRDMYLPTDAFGHAWHSAEYGANLGCYECHPKGQPKTQANGKKCASCHSDLVPAGSTIEFHHFKAGGYVEAMHNLCIGCHQVKGEMLDKIEIARCAFCHPGQRDFIDSGDIATRYRKTIGKRVVTPLLKD